MDHFLRMLKRRANVTNDPVDIWRYVQKLEQASGLREELPELTDEQLIGFHDDVGREITRFLGTDHRMYEQAVGAVGRQGR